MDIQPHSLRRRSGSLGLGRRRLTCFGLCGSVICCLFLGGRWRRRHAASFCLHAPTFTGTFCTPLLGCQALLLHRILHERLLLLHQPSLVLHHHLLSNVFFVCTHLHLLLKIQILSLHPHQSLRCLLKASGNERSCRSIKILLRTVRNLALGLELCESGLHVVHDSLLCERVLLFRLSAPSREYHVGCHLLGLLVAMRLALKCMLVNIVRQARIHEPVAE
mmetsp:Transcript_22536/g.49350  ORF Transcript_22536/g.49350 Transcript_22536/m.49350 type:complete len:220 (+) Transcript_22536:145-804(+)